MHPTDSTPSSPPEKSARANRLGALRIQLRSQLPSDFRRGMNQARQWLQIDPEDAEIYGLLLEIATENPALWEEIHNLLASHAERGSQTAAQTLRGLENLGIGVNELPSTQTSNQTIFSSDLMSDADDAYYAAEFDKAVRLYRQVLATDPQNTRARQQLEKAEINRISQNTRVSFPREAMQMYRRARSYIAARDIHSAIGMLVAAIEAAQAAGMKFPEAEDLLQNQQYMLTAFEYVENAEQSIQEGDWDKAFDLYERALRIDPDDQKSKDTRAQLRELLGAESILESLGDGLSGKSERIEKLAKIASAIKNGEGVRKLSGAPRLKKMRARYNLYQAATELDTVSLLVRSLSPHFTTLKEAIDSARKVLENNDPALQYAERCLKQQQPFRFALPLLIFVIALGAALALWQPISAALSPAPTSLPPPITETGTFTPRPTQILPPTLTATPTLTAAPTFTPTLPSTTTWTPIAFSPTPAFTFGYVATSSGVSAVDRIDIPNGRVIARLSRNQVVKILEKRTSFSIDYYLCEWEINGLTGQGWIPVKYILTGNPTNQPTETPTP